MKPSDRSAIERARERWGSAAAHEGEGDWPEDRDAGLTTSGAKYIPPCPEGDIGDLVDQMIADQFKVPGNAPMTNVTINGRPLGSWQVFDPADPPKGA